MTVHRNSRTDELAQQPLSQVMTVAFGVPVAFLAVMVASTFPQAAVGVLLGSLAMVVASHAPRWVTDVRKRLERHAPGDPDHRSADADRGYRATLR